MLAYKEFASVGFGWAAEGLWRSPFPGSVSYGDHASPAVSGMPESLVAKIREWHDEIDRTDPGAELAADPNLDPEASRAKGSRQPRA